MVEHQIVGGPVAYQHIAVAVQEIAPGSTNGGQGGVSLGVVGIAVGLDDLQDKELAGEQEQDESEQDHKQNGPETAYSFHVFPPIWPIL